MFYYFVLIGIPQSSIIDLVKRVGIMVSLTDILQCTDKICHMEHKFEATKSDDIQKNVEKYDQEVKIGLCLGSLLK